MAQTFADDHKIDELVEKVPAGELRCFGLFHSFSTSLMLLFVKCFFHLSLSLSSRQRCRLGGTCLCHLVVFFHLMLISSCLTTVRRFVSVTGG